MKYLSRVPRVILLAVALLLALGLSQVWGVRVVRASPTSEGCVSPADPHDSAGSAALSREAPCVEAQADDAQPTPVLNFSATSAAQHVRLSWATSSELEVAGFNLYRGTSTTAPNAPLNQALIPARGRGQDRGQAYVWSDYDVILGTSYFYWLESVDTANRSTLHGPVIILHQTPTVVSLDEMKAVPRRPWASLLLAGFLGVATVGVAYRWRTR